MKVVSHVAKSRKQSLVIYGGQLNSVQSAYFMIRFMFKHNGTPYIDHDDGLPNTLYLKINTNTPPERVKPNSDRKLLGVISPR